MMDGNMFNNQMDGFGKQEGFVRNTVTLKRFVLIESKAYKPQWLRPYELHADYTDIEVVKDTVQKAIKHNTVGGIDAELQKSNPNLLTPSSGVIGEAGIINGWNTKRFKFILVLESHNPYTNTTLINYVQGYSEFLDLSFRQNVDPNMTLFINSVTVLRKTFNTETGTFSIVPLYKYNVVQDDFSAMDSIEYETVPNSFNYDNVLKLSRPEDILVNVSTLSTVEPGVMVLSDVGNVKKLNVVDSKNVLPTQHLSSILSSAVNSTLTSDAFMGEEDLVGMMLGETSTNSPETIEIFKLIMSYTGKLKPSFTINELKGMLGLPDINYDVILSADAGSVMINHNVPDILKAEDTADTYGAEIETRKSILVHEGVVNALNNSLLSHIVFTIDNHLGEANFAILTANSEIEGLDVTFYANKFMSLFINHVWRNVTENNLLDVKLLVSADIIADTTIDISINGGPEVVYRYPTFADSKFIPLIVDNARFNDLTTSYQAVIETALSAGREAVSRLSRF